jgi:hypothetical protein
MSDVWTTKHVKIALGSAVTRINRDPTSFRADVKGKELNLHSSPGHPSVYISIDSSDGVYLSIGGFSGFYTPTKRGFFWQRDKDYEYITSL